MRLIIGITGASGVVMGYELLRTLRDFPSVETHLVMTEGAEKTFAYETGLAADEVRALAGKVHDIGDTGADIASGSFDADGMIVIPCSMKTLAGIVTGYAENLLLRAADVTLKEGRRLVLVPREMPLGLIHLRNLAAAAQLGAIIIAPMLTFYGGDGSLASQVQNIVGKVLLRFGLEHDGMIRWKKPDPGARKG